MATGRNNNDVVGSDIFDSDSGKAVEISLPLVDDKHSKMSKARSMSFRLSEIQALAVMRARLVERFGNKDEEPSFRSSSLSLSTLPERVKVLRSWRGKRVDESADEEEVKA